MNDIDSVEPPKAQAVQPEETPPKKKRPFSKAQKIVFTITAIVFGGYLMYQLLMAFFSAESSEASNSVSNSVVSSIPIDPKDKPSQEHIDQVEQSVEAEIQTATDSADTYIEAGLFTIETPEVSDTTQESEVAKTVIDGGMSADEKTPQEAEPEQQSNAVVTTPLIGSEDKPSGGLGIEDANDGGKGTIKRSPSRGGSGSSLVELKRKKLQDMKNAQTKSSASSRNARNLKAGNRMAPLEEEVDVKAVTYTEPSQSGGIQFNEQQSSTQQAQASSNRNAETGPIEGKGRGLRVGDILLGRAVNGLNSDARSDIFLVEVAIEPLKTAQIIFRPTYVNDTITYKSDLISFGEHQEPLEAFIVTPDENLTTGYASDVDYHTFERWAAIFLHGIAKGGAEYVRNVGGTVAVDGSTVVQNTEFDVRQLLVSAAGGVADSATTEVEKYINRPPTVRVFAQDLVGIVVVQKFNPPWMPFIPKHMTKLW